jgi:hypothetical protein
MTVRMSVLVPNLSHLLDVNPLASAAADPLRADLVVHVCNRLILAACLDGVLLLNDLPDMIPFSGLAMTFGT